ncbi:MAG: aminotransferase class V-fold PLP-dependent enzyme [Desulfobacteraceae bacterium]|nr:aminotransferase class V-fold PLP-dependent enzyme [Desulfobacteraceae bacterium]
MSFLSHAEIVIKALNAYYQESLSREKRVINQVPLEKLVTDMELAEHIRTGELSEDSLSRFLNTYLSSTTRLHHPAFLAHQVAPPHYAGALGSLVDGFTNNGMVVYEMGPGATTIEYFLINWLLEKIGWQPAPLKIKKDEGQTFGGGALTHGGSLANLTAMIAARTRITPNVWQDGNPNDLALLAPAECHYSIARATGILGIGHNSLYKLDVDDRGVVIPDRLLSKYKMMENDGKRAVALVANACSTGVGLYDPLQEIGEFCREKNLWFHVDGAHGASALLSDRHKNLLKGIELADSLTWDAHKMMRTPTLCAALLVRDHQSLDNAFEQEASYLLHEKERPGFDFIHRTVECTKAGLGLKLFFVLAALGEKGLTEYIDRQFELTMEAYEYIRQTPDFECPVEPQSNILCFRIKEDTDEMQLALRDKLTAKGDFYLSSAVFKDKRYLRLAFMNPNTSLDDIKKLISEVREVRSEK